MQPNSKFLRIFNGQKTLLFKQMTLTEIIIENVFGLFFLQLFIGQKADRLNKKTRSINLIDLKYNCQTPQQYRRLYDYEVQ